MFLSTVKRNTAIALDKPREKASSLDVRHIARKLRGFVVERNQRGPTQFGSRMDWKKTSLGSETSATSSVASAFQAPSCPIMFETGEVGGNGSANALPMQLIRLAGGFTDSEECTGRTHGWWTWWRYQGL